MKPKAFLYLGYFVILLATGMLLSMYGLMFYPYKTIDVFKTPLKILTPEVKRGESVVYEVDYCKYTDQQADVTISFTDGFSYPQPRVTSNTLKGCAKTQRAVIVPDNLPAQTYHLHITLEYRMNSLRTITKTYDTEKFKVLDEKVDVTPPHIDKGGRLTGNPSPTPVPTPIPIQQSQSTQLNVTTPESGASAQPATPTPQPGVNIPVPTVNVPVPTPVVNNLW